MLKYKILYGIMTAFSAALFLYANSAAALIFLVLMILLPIGIRFSLRDNAAKVKISCSMPNSMVVGAALKPVTITVENESMFPMGNIELVIEYENHMFSTKHTETVSLCGAGKKLTFEYMLDSERCGRSEVRIKDVYCCDVLNIMRRKIDYRWHKYYTVYPKLPSIRLYAQKLLSAEFGGSNYDRTRKGNDNSEVFQVREYEAGDNLSAAHWKLSAKMDDIIIRDWSRPKNFRLLVVFDLMKNDIEGKPVSFAVQSAIMGITSAISRELVDQGIGHNAQMLNISPILDLSINNDDDSSELLDDMMSIVVPERNDSIFEAILANDIHRSYSKLVYIGPEKNAGLLLEMSVYMNVTAIEVSDSGEASFNRSGNFSAYRISAQDIYSQQRYIEL